MKILMILLELCDIITCSLALCLGIIIIPYSIYNCVLFVINKMHCLFKINDSNVRNTYNGGYRPKNTNPSDERNPPLHGSSVSKGE